MTRPRRFDFAYSEELRMTTRRLVLAVCLAAAGCSHKLDDPKPAVATLMPNLVCAAQLTTAVTVSGTNLTPIPTKTLSGGEVLALPTVTLTEETDLSGAPMSSGAIALNQGTDAANAHVRWEAETQMSFDVTPDLMLAPGVYDVTVTNPDGKSATLQQALGVVPPPSVTAVMPMDICDAQQASTVMVTGQNFLVVGGMAPEVDVYDANGMPLFTAMATASGCMDAAAQLNEMIQLCTTLTISVPKDALPVGTYTLRVTNPAPAACQSSETITFKVEPPPVLNSVVPSKICAGGGTLDLQGMSFLPTATASISDPTTGQKVDAATTTVNAAGTDAVGKFLVSGGLTVGDKLDVTIRNNDGCSATLPGAVTVVSGPIIFYVDPPYVYGGIVTPVTVYTTGGITMLKSVTLTPNGMPNATPIDVTSASAIDQNHPNHVIINVPASLAAGAYDLTIDNQLDCPAFFAKAITVVTKTTPIDMTPRFGGNATDTPVTITAASDFFAGGARAYLAPHAAPTPTAIPIASVVFQSAKQLTGVVRAPIAVGGYDLIVVNPNGTIGYKASAFTVVNGVVPSIDPTSPGSLPSNCATSASCNLPLDGQNFDASNPSSDMVSASCTTSGGTTSTVTTPIVGQPTATAITLDLTNAAALGAGTLCTFHLTQVVGGVTVAVDGGTLVIRNPAAKLSATSSGMMLNTGREGLGLAYSGPTATARYLYAVGGDGGSNTMLLDSVEFAKVDPAAGGTAPWTQLPLAGLASSTQGKLPSARTQLGLVAVGRFLYAIGGITGGTTATTSVLRAESLDPAEAPTVNDADLTPDASAGLAQGLYYYRVAALFNGTDALNPSGETLASDEFAISVPAFGTKKLDVTIAWKNSSTLGARTASGWRVYRTTAVNAMPGTEDEFADVPGATLSIVDTGASITIAGATPTTVAWAAGKPLPFGAIGNWANAAAQLGTARAGAGVTHVVVPTPAPGTGTTDIVYVGYGGNGATLPETYDAFTVTGAAANAPVETALVGAPLVTGRGRWQLGAFGVTPDVDPNGGGDFVYFGSGNGATPTAGGGSAVNGLDRCQITTVAAGFGTLVCTGVGLGNVGPTSDNVWGYGSGTVADSLYFFGGTGSGGLTDKIGTAPDTASPNFTANGGGTVQLAGASFPVAYLGSTIGGAYFWLAGGMTGAGVTKQTFYTLY